MKKFVIILIVFFSVSGIGKLFATGINFVENKSWKQLLALAKNEHKLIFLDGYASWCGPCKYLQQNVFTQASVGLYFNKTFINAKMDMEAGEGPAIAGQFKVTAYPTLFFINSDGKLVHKSVGALEANNLIALGHDAVNPKKQYYTLKEQARAGKLIPADFLTWVKEAEQLEDEDAAEIVKNYMTLPGNPLLEKDMLDIAIYHAATLTDEQLTRLQQHRKEVMQIEGMTTKEFNKAITQKTVSLALEKAFKDSTLDFGLYEQVIAKYQPENAALETQKMKVKYYNYKQEYAKSLDALAGCFDTAAYHLSADELTTLVENNVKIIVENNRGEEFIAKIKQYALPPEDVSLSYYPDVALLLIYHEMKDKAQTGALVQKIVNNADAPERLKTAVRKLQAEAY